MSIIHWQRTVLALAAASLASTAAQANIQIKYEVITGPPISGQSVLKEFVDTIDAHSFQWGVGVGVGAPTGAPGGARDVSAPSVSEVTWTYSFDTSYNQLSKAALTGGRYNTAYSFVDPDPSRTNASWLTMQTGTSAISGLSISSGGDRPSVAVSQASRNFELTYDPSKLGLAGSAVTVGYDSVTGITTGSNSRTLPAPAAGSGNGNGIYMRLGDGPGAIFGDSTTRGYENWINLSSFQMGLGIGLAPDGDDFMASRPSVSEVTVSRSFDGASLAILANLLRGRVVGQATVEFVRGSPLGPVTYLQYELDNVIFSGLSISSGGDRPSESDSLNFTGFRQTAWEINDDGTRVEASSFHYDIGTGEVTAAALPAARSFAGFGPGLLSPDLAATPVPEPQTWALMAGGLALLAWRRGQRKSVYRRGGPLVAVGHGRVPQRSDVGCDSVAD